LESSMSTVGSLKTISPRNANPMFQKWWSFNVFAQFNPITGF
jgi:hypothetical protein